MTLKSRMASLEKQGGREPPGWMVGSEAMVLEHNLPRHKCLVAEGCGIEQPIPYSYELWLTDLGYDLTKLRAKGH